MGLKAFVKTLDDVDEAFHSFYVKDDDGYVLDVDDKDYKGRLNEFRTNNISYKQNLEELTDKLELFKDVDPAKYKEGQEALEKLLEQGDKDLMDAGKVDELLHQRTERMRSDLEGKVTALSKGKDELGKERDSLKSKLSRLLIDSKVHEAVNSAAAPLKGAMEDILARAHRVFILDEAGEAVPKDIEGKTIYGKDGEKPLTFGEWATSLTESAPFLFEASSGGGGRGSGDGKGGTAPGTISKDDHSAFGNNLEKIAKGEVKVA